MLNPKEYRRSTEYLEERLIMYNRGQRYGQIVFLVGGAGSGKGYALSNFMEKEKFKVRDVDEWKRALMQLDAIASELDHKALQKGIDTKKKFGVAAKDLNLNKAKDVFVLHSMVMELGWKQKTLELLLGDKVASDRLPNIVFDITGKQLSDITTFLPQLRAIGYNSKNIHVTWVLTNYRLAMQRNLDPERGRVVPADIMLKTHVGAAKTMNQIIQGKIPRGINGAVNVILNNQENTVFWSDSRGRPIKT